MVKTLLWISVVLSGFALGQQNHKTWSDYGGVPDSSHFVALNQINKSNVRRLQVAWTYPVGDEDSYVFNPIIVDDVMYVLARHSSLVALNAATGKEIWIHANLPGLSARGIAYWESRDRKDRRLIFATNDYLEEIDARTGQSILSLGKNGLVNLREGLGRDPKKIARIQSSKVPLGQDGEAAMDGAKNTGAFMAERHGIVVTSTGLVFAAASDGKFRAYDEETGDVLWTGNLPARSEGIPAAYDVNGREFIVVPASSKINTGGGHKP